jgi:DHA2 family multidrug resistance protein-like MFS transporter
LTASITARPSAAPVPEQDGLPTPRRYWAILAIWLGMAMAVLDGAVANVALPTIARDLAADPATSIWVINAYQLAIVVALLPLASLGDKIGYRRVYVMGLAVFTAGSLACALSHDLGQLIAARVLQGLGAAGIMSINGALVRFTYPQSSLGRGIGMNAVVISIAAAVGPTIASAILATSTWQWLFAINLPLGLAAMVVGLRALPATPTSGARLNLPSTLLNAVTFGGLFLGVEGLARGEGLRAGLVLLVGLAAGWLLVRREQAQPAPMIPLDLLKIRALRLALTTSALSFTAQMLAFVALPFHLEALFGRSAVQIGLLMTPWPIVVGLAAPLAGRLADRYPAGLLGGIGLSMFATGLVTLALLPHGAADWAVILPMALCGAGFGLFQSPNNRAILTSAPRQRSGAAGGLLASARLLGQTTGAVAMAAYFHLDKTNPTTAALATAAAMAAIAAGSSLLRLRAVATA